jgi:nitroimidazol reductase NimA-like FMN-containing flavoprotein (pyridoxamine 5'-phosphate oxidase superfamily)
VTAGPELRARAEAILAANQYMTLATADGEGVPWASPVWYASADHREFLWVSSPEARHSRNIAVRPEVGIVIFDSQQPPGTGHGVYVAAVAAQVPESEVEDGIATFSRISSERGVEPWSRSDVAPPAKHRLYRAVARERFVLSARDERIPID